MDKESRISVCLASFNGEAYIREQLKSILAQSLLPIEIVVSDDCSTDDTVRVVEEFGMASHIPVRIYKNKENLGFVDNFFNGVRHCVGDYIAFCDQDDVWDTRKLKSCMEWFENDQSAVLVVHNAWVTDESLNVYKSYWEGSSKSYAPLSIDVEKISSPGCCFLFKSFLTNDFDYSIRPRALMSDYRCGLSHDQWVVFLAMAMGNIVFDARRLIYYRQHEANKCGAPADTALGEKMQYLRDSKYSNYRRVKDVLLEWSGCCESLAGSARDEKIKDKLLGASKHWADLAGLYHKRQDLYEASNFTDRWNSFIDLLSMSGYRKRSSGGLGFKSSVKDLLRVTGALGS